MIFATTITTGLSRQMIIIDAVSFTQVFACLRNNSLHIPYRNSKLTHLLQPSLGGDAKVNEMHQTIFSNIYCILVCLKVNAIRIILFYICFVGLCFCQYQPSGEELG